MNMVKTGELSIDKALKEAQGLGVASTPYEDLDLRNRFSSSQIKGDEVYNFGVHRYSKGNKSVKCVLQLDFPEHTMYFVQRGQRSKRYDFASVKHAESEDGTTRLFVSMDDTTEFEIDANSFEDRNRLVRLLNYIVEQQGYSEDGLYVSNLHALDGDIIKEGIIEKKGHNAASLVWAKRFVRVKAGELLYFKIGDEVSNDNALNVIQLGHGAAFVKKADDNGFVMITNQREYSFRIAAGSMHPPDGIERARDEWIIAIQEASRPARFNSVAQRAEELNDPIAAANEQEKFLKTVIGTLQEELEQLNTILTIVDAPFKASIQVRRVREIVQKLDEQVKTGLLSWTMRSMAQGQLKMQKGGDAVMRQGSRQFPTYGVLRNKSSLEESHAHQDSDQYKGESNVLTVSHRFDFRRSRQAVIDATGMGDYQEINFQQSGNAELQKFPEGKKAEGSYASTEKPPLLDLKLIRGHDAPHDQTEANYAQVDKERTQKIAQEPESPQIEYDDDNPPPLPPRKSSHSVSSVNNADQCCEVGLEKDKKEHDSVIISSVRDEECLKSNVKKQDEKVKNEAEPHKDFSTPTSAGSMPPLAPPNKGDGTPPPPPPPPPPPLPQGSSGVPPPPPPQGSLPRKSEVRPKKNLKPLFWTKVPDITVTNSFWAKAVEKWDVFDFTTLESLFEADSKVSQMVAAKPVPQQSKTMLDGKKAQNLGIFLSGFKLHPEDIESRLTMFDDNEGLLQEHLVALKRFQPNTDELEMYKNFQGNEADLSLVDRFMLKLCHIPNLSKKLDILLTIMEVPSQYDDIQPSVISMLEACMTLEKSSNFEKLLEYILTVGNYLNGGTTRGGAYGFKISSLGKLVNVRSCDKKHSLLSFVVQQLYDKDASALKCYEEIPGLLVPMDASVKGLSAEIDVMKGDLRKAEKHIEAVSKGEWSESEKMFLGKASDVISNYAVKLGELGEKCNEVQDVTHSLLRKFGENSNVNVENWLKDVAEFLKQLKTAVEDEEGRRKRKSRRPGSPCSVNDSAMEGGVIGREANASDQSNSFHGVIDELSVAAKTLSKKAGQDESFKFNQSFSPIVPKDIPVYRSNGLDPPLPPRPQKTYQTSDEFAKSSCAESEVLRPAFTQATPYELKKAEILHHSSHVDLTDVPEGSGFASPIPSTQPIKKGYLEKLSGGKKRAPKWDRRYFEVTSSGYLLYSKKENTKPVGSIYLRGCPVQQGFDDPTMIHVESEDRDWQLQAETAQDAKEWVDILLRYARCM